MVTHGLFLGTFMPVQQGHLALLEATLGGCARLTVALLAGTDDPIPAEVRLGWLRTLLAEHGAVSGVEILSLPPPVDTDDSASLLGALIRARFPTVEVVYWAEQEPLEGLPPGLIPLASAGQQETLCPAPSAAVLQEPFRYWAVLPAMVRPYFVKRVCLYGPESVGKTTMGRQLADYYQTLFVEEVARDMVFDSAFTRDDIIRIGYAQTAAVERATQSANKILICDTDVITTGLYADIYLGAVPPVLDELEKKVSYALYCLLDIDVPWVSDGLRDLGHRRQEIFTRFEQALIDRKIPYLRVSGDWPVRWQTLTGAIDGLLARWGG